MSRHSLKFLPAAIACFMLVAFQPAIARAADPPSSDHDRPVVPPVHRKVGHQSATDTVGVFSGRAYGARVSVLLPAPSTRLYADTGLLATAGGSLSASLASVTDAMFSSGPTSCSSQGGSTAATSVSAMANLTAFVGTAAALSATSVESSTRATCSAVTGSTTISGLVFAGVSVLVTGAANQTVSVPGVATLVINERVVAGGAITVNGLHVTLASGDELIICSTHSDIECSTPTLRNTWGEVKAMYR
jgi:hypothetical protein